MWRAHDYAHAYLASGHESFVAGNPSYHVCDGREAAANDLVSRVTRNVHEPSETVGLRVNADDEENPIEADGNDVVVVSASSSGKDPFHLALPLHACARPGPLPPGPLLVRSSSLLVCLSISLCSACLLRRCSNATIAIMVLIASMVYGSVDREPCPHPSIDLEVRSTPRRIITISCELLLAVILVSSYK